MLWLCDPPPPENVGVSCKNCGPLVPPSTPDPLPEPKFSNTLCALNVGNWPDARVKAPVAVCVLNVALKPFEPPVDGVVLPLIRNSASSFVVTRVQPNGAADWTKSMVVPRGKLCPIFDFDPGVGPNIRNSRNQNER